MPEDKKNIFASMVCLFLAEGMRSRRISLKRSSEIADKIIKNLNLVDTEENFLSLIKELSKDFEELYTLEKEVKKHQELKQRRDLESHVKDFAIQIMAVKPKRALEILEQAASENASLEFLCRRFPEFNQFLANKSPKGATV